MDKNYFKSTINSDDGPTNNDSNDNDEELFRFNLLQKLENGLYPNDFLKSMIKEKGGPINTQVYSKISSNDESKDQKKFDEDTRLDYLLRMKSTLNEKFENSAYLHPHGMTAYDYQCIPEERRKGLEHYKMKVRRENYVYLNLHPDIDAIMSLFLQKVLKAQPAEPVKFAGEFFTLRGTTHADFVKSIDDEKKRLKRFHTQRPQNNITKNNDQSGTHQNHTGFRKQSYALQTKKLQEVNQIKKLGLGPLALDFSITPPPSRQSMKQQFKSTSTVQQPKNQNLKIEAVDEPTKPYKKFYCGCKDPGRRDHRKGKTDKSSKLLQNHLKGQEHYGEDEEEESNQTSSHQPKVTTTTNNESEVTASEEEEETFSDLEH